MKKQDFKIDHSGEHHLVEITSEKGVLGGKISNFGERGVATLVLRKGKVSGEISHSSDNHAASFLLKPDGTWSGKYSNTLKDGTLTLSLSKGLVRPSEVDLSLAHKGKNHDLSISVDQKGGFSGHIVRNAPNMSLKLEAGSKGHVSGEIGHTGAHHSLNVILDKNGTWTAQGMVDTKTGTLNVSVGKGEAKLNFKKDF
jgi:hypothetical protein